METSTQTINKNAELINGIVERGIITEKEIKLILRRMNSGAEIDLGIIWDNPVMLTPEQNLKGISYLISQWKTPKGVERKNNPFGYREQNVLDRFDTFEFAGTYDASRFGQSPYHIPLYNVCGKNGSFQYHMSGGVVNIVG